MNTDNTGPINPNNPPQAAAAPEQSVNTPPVSPPLPAESLPPQTPEVIPTVVIPEKKDRLPVWFYILFAVVAVVFLSITFILVKTLLDKSKTPSVPVVSNQTKNLPTPTLEISPSVEPTPVDEYLNSLNTLNNSDKTEDIEKDLNSTDPTPLKNNFTQIETDSGITQ